MAKLIINENNQHKAFIDYVTRIANKYGNKVTDSPILRKLEIELVNDLRSKAITLAVAEETYSRSAGIVTFNIDQIEL